MSGAKFEWRKRHDFAEVAETLGVSTEWILAVASDGRVLWTPSETLDGDIWFGKWERTPDGVLYVTDRRFLATAEQFQKSIRDQLDQAAGDA